MERLLYKGCVGVVMMKAKEKKKVAAENKAEEKDIGTVELTVEADELDLSV